MAARKPKNEYPCTMAELYTICRMGWNSFIGNIVVFTDFLTIYTPQFGQDMLDEIDAVEAMPEFQERNEATELALVELKRAAKKSLYHWNSLRRYIRSSFTEEDRKAMWESAGEDHYKKASHQNWSELRNMLTAGQNFIAGHTAELVAGGMPATFAGVYAGSRTIYNDALTNFTNLELDEVEGTDLKVEANNALYHKLMDMFEDGTHLFEDVPAKYERFVFAHLKETITNPGNSSGANDILFAGTMTDGSTALPLASKTLKASIVGSGEELTLVTNLEGMFKFRFVNLGADFTGSVVIKAAVEGYVEYTVTVPVEAGERYVADIVLVPLVA
jgi:hypothetical protein